MGKETRVLGVLVTPDGDDDITGSGVSYYHLGLATKTRGRFPYVEHSMGTYYRGSRDPTNYPVKATYKGAAAFAPVNGYPFYLAAGSSSTTTGVHTLSWLDSGSLPQWVARWEKRRTEHNIRKSMLANKVKALSLQMFNMNLRSPAFPLLTSLGWQGENIATAAYNANHDPVYPDGNGAEDQNPYVPDSNMVFDYDTAGDDIDYKSDIVDLIYNMQTTNSPQDLVGQYKPNDILEGNRSHQLAFTLLRRADTSVLDDYYAQDDTDETGKSINWRIYQTSTNYLDITWPNCFFLDVEEKDAEHNQPELWEVQMITGAPTIKIKDGLSEITFYGE